MTDTLNQFRWTKATDGYQVLETTAVGEEDKHWFLTDSVPVGKPRLATTYSPASGLFQSFAKLKPQRDQIFKFAGDWGLLKSGVGIRVGNNIVMGERLDTWSAEIKQLSIAVRLWELARDGNSTELSQYIIWPEDHSGVRFGVPNHIGGRWIASRTSNAELLQTFREGDRIRPAWHQLQYMVNEKLDGNVSARFLWNLQQTELSLHQVPRNLISALWLQFARAIEGNREYHQCAECRNWFEVSSPDGGRKDKRFCSTACRARDWRKKKGGK